jgi:predicted transposase/invertase (TIGR01784 family)
LLDYRVRVYRRFPDKAMNQVVIYLKPTNSELARQNIFSIPGTRHEFQVIRLWEEPAEVFLRTPGLLPFAALSNTDNPESILNDVAQQINRINELKTQSHIAASTAILAGLVLDQEVIKRILRSDIMRESVIYQDILEEGKAEGKAIGIAEGKAEALMEVARNLINTGMPLEQIAQVTGLSIEQIQSLQVQ